jgi:SAM-dependent methyltransferase
VVRVTQDPAGRFVRMVHGTTVHGQQRTAPAQAALLAGAAAGPLVADNPLALAARLTAQAELCGRIEREPLTYYHRTGPLGRLFAAYERAGRTPSVAAVGLGTGALAAYGRPGQRITFYEIDPAVARLAADTRYFTFLARSPAAVDVVLGDARLQLAREPRQFDLIVVDAFSSDAIPVHLLTREALAVYLARLAPGGVLAFHLSNRYLDLPPLIGKLGESFDPPLAVRLGDDRYTSDAERSWGKSPSLWVVAARGPDDLQFLTAASPYWSPVRVPPLTPLWTDDFSNLLRAWRVDPE